MRFKTIFRLFLIGGFLFSLGSCKDAPPKQAIKTSEITFTREGELSVYQSGTEAVLAQIDIEIAETEYETSTGLMYRKGMEKNQGMLFIFDYVGMHSFYMKNTEFDIDIIFIDDEYKIASYHDRARAMDETGISSKVPIRYVLEINAGLRSKWGLEIGDRIGFTRP
ncbi:MAG: DUF192 domain-containing protein [Flavobacteriaceae bacterium]